jgi:hypothetical protein
MKDCFILPGKWRHLVFVLTDLRENLSRRFMLTIERLNCRMAILEAKRRSA